MRAKLLQAWVLQCPSYPP